jgi:hypothetical protein
MSSTNVGKRRTDGISADRRREIGGISMEREVSLTSNGNPYGIFVIVGNAGCNGAAMLWATKIRVRPMTPVGSS